MDGSGTRRVIGIAAVIAVLLGGAAVVAGIVRPDQAPAGDVVAGPPSYPVRASEDGTSLVDADGDPFLYLADTVWLAPSRLDRTGMRDLLDARAAQGFTTVQVSVLPFLHLPGGSANTEGAEPVEGTDLAAPIEVGERTDDPRDPDYDYWDHLDALVALAAERDMLLTLVPSWYGYRGEDWRGYVDVEAARAYGRFLGERLGHHPNLVWLLGGDNAPAGDTANVPDEGERRDVVDATRAMAEAIRDAEAVPHLMSYHATRGVSSVELFGDDEWHTFASAYGHDLTWRNVADSRGNSEPVILTEAFYDGREQVPVIDRRQLRAQAWWSLLGGAGFAYGHEDVWDLDPGHGPDSDGGAESWRDALEAPSAADMSVLAETVGGLLPLRPADDDVLLAGLGDDADRASAALSADGRTALVYLPQPRTIEVDLRAVGDGGVDLAWLDPATGSEQEIETPDGDRAELRPPEELADAVLVVRRR